MELKQQPQYTISSTETQLEKPKQVHSKNILCCIDWIVFSIANANQFCGGMFFIIGSSLSIANVRYYFNSSFSYSIAVVVFYVLGSVCFVVQALTAWIQEIVSKRRRTKNSSKKLENNNEVLYMRHGIATMISFACLSGNILSTLCFLGGSISYCFAIGSIASSTALFISIVLWCIGSYGMFVGKFFFSYAEYLQMISTPSSQHLLSKMSKYKQSCAPSYFVNQLLYLGVLGFVLGSTCFIFTLPWQFSNSVVDFMNITGSVLWILGSFGFSIASILVATCSLLEVICCNE